LVSLITMSFFVHMNLETREIKRKTIKGVALSSRK